MGEWYDHKVRFKDGEDIVNRLINDDYAAIYIREGDNSEGLSLHIAKIDNLIADSELGRKEGGKYLGNYYKDRNENSYEDIHIGIGRDRQSLFYVNKWAPNFSIPLAISILYPDKVLEAVQFAPYYDHDYTSYIKNGAWTNKEGEKLTGELYGLNTKLIKNPEDDIVRVSLPIGPEDDRWGHIKVPAKNITAVEYETGEKIANGVFFTEDTVNVRFKSGVKTYTVKDLADAYYESKNAYRNRANEQIYLENFPAENIERRGDYYIAKIHVPPEVSANGILRTTIPDYNVKEETEYRVNLGKRLGIRNAYVLEPGNDEPVKKQFCNEDIKKYYDETPQRGHIEAEAEEDVEMEI